MISDLYAFPPEKIAQSETQTRTGFLDKQKLQCSNYYIKLPFFNLLKGENGPVDTEPVILTRRLDQV